MVYQLLFKSIVEKLRYCVVNFLKMNHFYKNFLISNQKVIGLILI